MFKTKSEVDRHVYNCLKKINNEKEVRYAEHLQAYRLQQPENFHYVKHLNKAHSLAPNTTAQVLHLWSKKQELDVIQQIQIERHLADATYEALNIQINLEKTLRYFSFAKLYFTVGDYDQAYRYVSSYLTVNPKSAEGYQLLGKCLEKLGKLDAALDAYRNSLQIDPKQNNLVIKVCELLSSDNIELDLSGARYFCDLAQTFDPNNPAVHSLKERLIMTDNENPNETTQLLLKELELRPTDVNLRVRLLKHFIQNNLIKEAYKHAAVIEEKDIPIFRNSINWYENFADVLLKYQKEVSVNSELTWEFWLLSVSVLERLAALSLDDRRNIKGGTDYLTAVFNFDQMVYKASQNVTGQADRQLLSTFLTHYHAQLQFHMATLVYKQAKKDIIQFKEAANILLPSLFIAYHTQPPDLQSVWYIESPENTKRLLQRWYRAGCFRCSQTGHIILAIAKDKRAQFLEKASQYASGMWREQLFKKVYVKRDQQAKILSSLFVVNIPALDPVLKLPDVTDLLKYDEISQLSFPDSLHHYIWIALNSNISELNIVTFEGMQFSTKNLTNCSAESLNVLDIYAFIYCATICAQFKLKDNKLAYYNPLPAAVTDNLGTIQQINFLESAYKMYKNEVASNLGDVRVLLIKGIEIVRCIGHHGLDLKVLINLARIFEERAEKFKKQSEIDFAIARAELYWKTALPLLEKVKNNQKIVYPNNRLFELKDDDFSINEAQIYIEKGKLFLGRQFMKNKNYDEALSIFEQLKNPYASFYQFEIYKNYADLKINEKNIENLVGDVKRDITMFLTKARDCLYLTLDRLKDSSVDSLHPLNFQLGTELEKIERMLNTIESDQYDILSEGNRSLDNSIGEHYLSTVSQVNQSGDGYITKLKSLNQSTPSRPNIIRQETRPSPERLDAQIRQMMTSRDIVFTLVSEQNRNILEGQKNLMEKFNSLVDFVKTVKKDVEDLKDVAKSVEEIKHTVQDFQNITDFIQEMKKELGEIKKGDTTKNQLSDEDLYVLDPDYGVDYNVASNITQFPPTVPAPAAAYPNYQPGRIPNPGHVAAYAPPMLYPGLYPGLTYPYGGLNLPQPGPLSFLPEQPPTNLQTAIAPRQPALPQNLLLEALSGQTLSHTVPQPLQQLKDSSKEPTITSTPLKIPTSITVPTFGKAPPVNVVITSSDPLPKATTTTTQPILSVTIPPQHIKSNFLKPGLSSIPPTPVQNVAATKETDKSSDNLNTSNVSDSPEEHEPNVDFKPLIPLPDEVPVTTGEETETELFCERAKLFRHVNVDGVKEWKERGVGNLKILNNPQTGKSRILMRRDQVFKICANHFITKDMSLITNDKTCMWAAQDFSDGKIVRETFCAKFKTIEEIQKFIDVFEKSKNAEEKPIKAEPEKIKEVPQNGTSLGGFTFTSTPTFKPMDVNKPPATVVEVKDVKGSPFSTFFFGKTDTKVSEAPTFTPLVISQENKDGERSTSPVEEFEPTAEFKPLVPLPKLVEVKTGEENCEILFEARTKLFRYDSSGETKEWKERGVGMIKILKDDTVRLLMRRDQVHKVCCNHRVVKDMVFKANSNNPKAIVWQAQDFSEGVIKPELFTARFKTEEIANEFLEILRKSQNSMDENNDIKPEKTPESTGFGEAFKPKPGTWECDTCMIRNQGNVVKCVSCNMPKEEKAISDAKSVPVKATVGFGDAFKAKPGSWECKTCMIRNDAGVVKCKACETPNEDGLRQQTTTGNSMDKNNDVKPKKKPESTGFGEAFKPKPGTWECDTCMIRNPGNVVKCVACNTPNTEKAISDAKSVPVKAGVGFGDAFKAKPGSWECKTCMIRNDAGVVKCKACETPNEDGLRQQSTTDKPTTVTFGQKFSFGIPNTGQTILPTTDIAKNVQSSSTPDAKWSFGIPKTPSTPLTLIQDTNKSLENKNTTWSFGIQSTPTTTTTVDDKKSSEAATTPEPNTWSFGIAKTPTTISFKVGGESKPTTPVSVTTTISAGTTTPTIGDSKVNLSFVSLPTKQEFEFKQKPPRRISQGHEESDADASYVEEEEDNIYFKPVIPLPNEIQVKTGEEEEDVLYCHKAKLFRFVNGEWKERGLGDIKILKNKENGKLRIVMRRTQILKICLNHMLTKDIKYIPKDEKSLMFIAADFSDGELVKEQFCVRFKNAEIAEGFKKAVNDALDGITPSGISAPSNQIDEDIEIIFETQVTAEEEQQALRLGLPPKFMSYKQLSDCKCDQCKKDDEYLKELFATETPKVSENKPITTFTFSFSPPASKGNASTPPKSGLLLKPSILSPQNSKSPTFSWPVSSSASIFSSNTNNSFGNSIFPNTNIFSTPTTKSDNTIVSNSSNNLFSSITSSKSSEEAATNPVFPVGGNKGTFNFNIFGQNPNMFLPKSPTSTTPSILGQHPTTVEIFGQSPATPTTTSNIFVPKTTTNIFAPNLTTPTTTSNKFGQITPSPSTASNLFAQIPAAPITTANIFGQNPVTPSTTSNIFEQTPATPSTTANIFGQNPVTPSTTSNIFGQTPVTPSTTSNIFGQNPIIPTTTVNIFGQNPVIPSTTSNIFGTNKSVSSNVSIFGSNPGSNVSNIFGSTIPSSGGNIFGNTMFNAATDKTKDKTGFVFGKGSLTDVPSTTELKENDEVVLKCDSNLSFASLAANKSDGSQLPAFGKTDEKFAFVGAGTPVFSSLKSKKSTDVSKADSDDENDTSTGNEECDPHYEPIIPLPEAIIVTTGEENETVIFNERAKLFRYDADTKEWKERGVGPFKVLYHPEKNIYRLLLRREQVYKVVLNQLITSNFELQPMLTTDKAWIWAGYNYVDDENVFEKLAVRFKNVEQANQFRTVIEDVIKKISSIGGGGQEVPLSVQDFTADNDDENEDFNHLEEASHEDYDYGDEEEDEEDIEDEEDERSVMFTKKCTLSELDCDNTWTTVSEGYLEVYYDFELYASRITVNDNEGINLSNTLIAVNTVMDRNKNECTWKAVDWVEGDLRWRNLKVTFDTEAAAEELYSYYLESLNYAQQIGLVDEIPLEHEEQED